jgi:hypothetical protein
MIKKFAMAVCLSAPLLGLASNGTDAKPAANAASAASKSPAAQKPAAPPAPASTVARTNKEEQLRVQARGSAMGACQKQAAEQNLSGVERKQFLGACVNGK